MSLRERDNGLVFWGSLLTGLILTLVALPEPYGAFRPFWLGLLVVYWALESPSRMGLGLAFALGIAGDFLTGSPLGEHALRLVVLAFIVLRLRPRMRFFPMPQQTAVVLGLLLNDRVVLLMLRAFTGEGVPDWLFWVGPVMGALLWPWLFLLIDLARSRARARDA
jgi:rod shape-determining protein MreD